MQIPGWALQDKGGDWYEHAVLVTSWEEKEIDGRRAGLSRPGGHGKHVRRVEESVEWTGFSTQDLKRSQLMARMVALIFNWWTLKRIARHTQHAKPTHISFSSLHAKVNKLANLWPQLVTGSNRSAGVRSSYSRTLNGPLSFGLSSRIAGPNPPAPIPLIMRRFIISEDPSGS